MRFPSAAQPAAAPHGILPTAAASFRKAAAPGQHAAAPRTRQHRHWRHAPCRTVSDAESAPRDSTGSDGGRAGGLGSAALLDIRSLKASVAATGKPLLRGVTLAVGEGEVHALMGKNGSGKTTLAKVLVGHPDYQATSGSATFKGVNLLALKPQERARMGLFLSFQSPVQLPGVANIDFLRLATNARRQAEGLEELGPLEFYAYATPMLEALHMDPSFLSRDVNKGFSGGEMKRNEILQLACLQADVAILDEIDSGLDIDALHDVAAAVNGLRLRRPGMGLLIITHYKRLLNLIQPDCVHIMQSGRIAASGDIRLVDRLEADGYSILGSVQRSGP